MIERFVILGATGDLTSRYLLPALATLWDAGSIPASLVVVGIGRDDTDTTAFRDAAAEAVEKHAPGVSGEARGALVEALEYRRADASDATDLSAALGADDDPFVAYLALPPGVFLPAIEGLAAMGPPAGSAVVVEKPFGEDLESARRLNHALGSAFPEDATFRIDHFLHKQTVQNVLGLRFANRIFEPVWTSRDIERVEILWDETLTAEGRASYYDSAGALEDMVQNHLLQLLTLVAMEPPDTLGARDLRDRKVDVLRATMPPGPDEMATAAIRARYTSGRVDGRDVGSYVDEEGVDPARGTETFAEVILRVENDRWSGVPFVLRSGKGLAEDRRSVGVSFRTPDRLPFDEPATANRVRFELDPDRLALDLSINGAGDPFDLEAAQLDVTLAPQELPAYARLLLDVLERDPTLSIRADEAEESWRIIEPVSRAWRRGVSPLLEYPAGSAGPTGAAGPVGE